jgi:hypothetical protein
LIPSNRDHGLSGSSSHPKTATWSYDYHLDLLGAWDYAVNDPDGLLGGSLPADKVGIAGFSKGGLVALIAFGIEKRIAGAWIDSAPFGGVRKIFQEYIARYTPLLPVNNLYAFVVSGLLVSLGNWYSGLKQDSIDASALLKECGPGQRRPVLVAQGQNDTMVPVTIGRKEITFFGGIPRCYELHVYTPNANCNGDTHHVEMWQHPDDTEAIMRGFWKQNVFKQSGE